MQCPCGSGDVSRRDFQAWLKSANQEARMAALATLKADPFGGHPMRVRDGKLVIGPDEPERPKRGWLTRVLGR